MMNNTELEKAKNAIYSVDLQSVIDRLVKIERWSRVEAEETVKQYRNYLFLRKKYPDYSLPPSKDIDEAWHAHILHTQEYRSFCKQAFSEKEDQYLDHHPHTTKAGTTNKLNQLFEQTQNLYRKEFGDYIYEITGRPFFQKILDKFRDYLAVKFPELADDLDK